MRKDYQEVTIIKNKKKKLMIFFISFVLIFVFAIFCSVLFSPILKLAQIASTNIYQYSKDFFVVCLNSNTQEQQEAKKQAQNLKSRGGAGVVFFDEGYFVAVSCYNSFDEASIVAQNLSTEEQTYEIKTFSIILNTKNLSKDERAIVKDHFNFFVNVLECLYNLANALDKNEINEFNANLKIKSLKLESKAFLDELLKNYDTHFEISKKMFLNLCSNLEYASEQEVLSIALLPYSSVLRQTEISIIFNQQKT